MTEQPIQETLLSTTIAGMTAASFEAFVTYPLEYMKTRHQLFRYNKPGATFIAPVPSKIYFSGCSAIVAGNSIKAMLRYSIYNQMTKFMADGADGDSTPAPQIVVAGMFTGLFESLVVVPFESIKTTMIERSIKQDPYLPPGSEPQKPHEPHNQPLHQNQKSHIESQSHSHKVRSVRPPAPTPQFVKNNHIFPVNTEVYGLFANIRDMHQTRGLRSFIQGFGPTMIRQITNSMVKFTTYNFLKQAVHSPNDREPISSTLAMALGFTAGAVQVLSTQPIDVIKTRMQSINGLPEYRSSLICGYKIFVEEGPTRLWTGTLPRLIKVSFSGAIVFTVYEATNKLVAHGMRENPFASS